MAQHNFSARLVLLSTVVAVLAGCASAPKPVPRVATPVPGSAPGPVYGQAAPGTARSWSPQMETAERQLRSALDGTGVTLAKTTDERLWVTLPGDLAFQANRSALKPAATAVLDKVGWRCVAVPRPSCRIVRPQRFALVGPRQRRAHRIDRAASTREGWWRAACRRCALPWRAVARATPGRSNDEQSRRANNAVCKSSSGEKAKAALLRNQVTRRPSRCVIWKSACVLA